ncbi:unnamed protein product, partial [Hapterophycus canaliculatus]
SFQALTAEVESLQAFSGERDRVNAQLAALEAANAELQDQQEIRMQSLRKKLSDLEAAKQGDVARLVLEAKENMRDEVEIAFGGSYERLVKENQELKDSLKNLDSKFQIVLSELEHEIAAKVHLKTELEISTEMESKSAGKIKYYMRLLQRSAKDIANQLVDHGCGGQGPAPFRRDSAGTAAAAGTSGLRLCRSCGSPGNVGAGAGGIIAGGRGGGGRRLSTAGPMSGVGRPGTAPANIRRRG